MNHYRAFALLLVSAAFAVAPYLVMAATGDFTGSIVPADARACPAGWASLIALINNLVQFAIYLGIIIAVLVAAYAGFLLVTNAANPENRQKAKGMFINAAIGLIFVLAAWLIVNTFVGILGAGDIGSLTSEILTGGDTCIKATTTPSIFSSPSPSATSNTSSTSSGGTAISQAVCSAANAYRGTSTASAPGTNGGRSACAWAVSQVVQKAGYSGFSSTVSTLESQLTGGRGTSESQSDAVCGDIVVEASGHHVGICLNAGCTSVISNSSSKASFSWVSGPDFAPSYTNGIGRFYRLTN